ncbi:MAG: TnpV protein [Oscillospiraceae bacterium]|nr:TnpV protein [Oscillospiraceae bacterium]
MKSLFEELGGIYHQEGDYFLPDLLPPDSISVGIWGQRRKHYLKTQREPLYNALLLSGKLDDHLAEIDTQAEDMFFQLVKQLAEQAGITEQLKAQKVLPRKMRKKVCRLRTE